MLNIFIKYLEKILNFLKNRQEKEVLSEGEVAVTGKWSKRFIAVSWLLLVAGVMFFWALFILEENILGESFIMKLLWFVWLLIINIWLIVALFKNLTWKYFFLVHVPLYMGMFVLIGLFEKGFVREFGSYNLLLNVFLIVYPLIYISQYYFDSLTNNKYLNKIKNLAYFYNLGFFFFFALNVFVISIWFNIGFIQPWSMAIIEILDASRIRWIFEFFLILGLTFIFLLYAIYSLHVYFDNAWKKRASLHKWIWVFVLIYCLGFTSGLIDWFYNHQIKTASNIISEEGYNYEAYKDAKVMFLDRAFYNRIKDGKRIDESLFKKIYDTTPEGYYGDKISEYRDNRYSFETKLSKVGEKADVVLSLAEIENNVFTVDWKNEYKLMQNNVFKADWKEKVQLLETIYKFHFTNTSTTNQEVIINFEAPSKASVVTSLKLGLDLQLVWQISSRWAARQVYEDSLRKNIDPALIEKVWLNTYSLRVFPVPSKRDTKTSWKQLVELKILTPITEESFIYSPKFSVVNLKFDDKSNILSKVYNDNVIKKEDIIKNKEIEGYISKDHIISGEELGIEVDNGFKEMCLSSMIQIELNDNNIVLDEVKALWNKTSLFFDNSLSVDRSDANKLYENIYSGFKNYGGVLNDTDLYSYNFDVTKITEVSDIDYWGASNIDRTIDYIVNNHIENQRIVFVTDDDSFNFDTNENSSRNLKFLSTNTISVIKIWKKIKSYKSDFNTILSATDWNIYEVNSASEIDNVLAKILNWSTEQISFKKCEVWDFSSHLNQVVLDWTGNLIKPSYSINADIATIQAWIVSNILLSTIESKNDWLNIAKIQTTLAESYNIVNQFNSLIALQTAAQQRDLDRYNERSDKYDVEYENYWWTNKGSGFNTVDSSFGIESVSESGLMNDSATLSVGSSSMRGSSMSINSDMIMTTWDSMVNGGLSGASFSSNLYSGRTDMSIVWIFIFIIYLLEYIWFINFIIKYIKQK